MNIKKMKKLNYFWMAALAFSASLGTTSCSEDDPIAGDDIKVIADDEAAPLTAAKGFYVVNEDWFGHDNGTVNYFKAVDATTYEATYRIYRAVNGENEQLGVTTQFGTIWGDNFYLMSKQGNRLVVADAQTMEKKAALEEIGGDGRGFAGISDTKAYVGHSAGIAVFDIPTLSVTKQIAGVEGQTGMMCLADNRLFAVVQSKGVYVINPETDEVEKNIEGSFNTLTCSKDGQVWVAGSNGFLRIDPATLETAEVAYPEGGSVGSSWGAWNAGSLCASTQSNTLYWSAGGGMFGGGKKVLKYDIDTQASSVIYELGTSDDGQQMEFYGAGLRIDPLTDNLILTVKHSGWGASGAFNWIYQLSNTGQEITHFAVKGDNGSAASWAGNAEDWNEKYFWFPALPVFEDANKPQILLNQIMVTAGETKEIDLDEKVVDYDNTLASIQMSVTSDEKGLIETTLEGHQLKVVAGSETGVSSIKIAVLSNGVRVEKEIQVAVIE